MAHAPPASACYEKLSIEKEIQTKVELFLADLSNHAINDSTRGSDEDSTLLRVSPVQAAHALDEITRVFCHKSFGMEESKNIIAYFITHRAFHDALVYQMQTTSSSQVMTSCCECLGAMAKSLGSQLTLFVRPALFQLLVTLSFDDTSHNRANHKSAQECLAAVMILNPKLEWTPLVTLVHLSTSSQGSPTLSVPQMMIVVKLVKNLLTKWKKHDLEESFTPIWDILKTIYRALRDTNDAKAKALTRGCLKELGLKVPSLVQTQVHFSNNEQLSRALYQLTCEKNHRPLDVQLFLNRMLDTPVAPSSSTVQSHHDTPKPTPVLKATRPTLIPSLGPSAPPPRTSTVAATPPLAAPAEGGPISRKQEFFQWTADKYQLDDNDNIVKTGMMNARQIRMLSPTMKDQIFSTKAKAKKTKTTGLKTPSGFQTPSPNKKSKYVPGSRTLEKVVKRIQLLTIEENTTFGVDQAATFSETPLLLVRTPSSSSSSATSTFSWTCVNGRWLGLLLCFFVAVVLPMLLTPQQASDGFAMVSQSSTVVMLLLTEAWHNVRHHIALASPSTMPPGVTTSDPKFFNQGVLMQTFVQSVLSTSASTMCWAETPKMGQSGRQEQMTQDAKRDLKHRWMKKTESDLAALTARSAETQQAHRELLFSNMD